MLINITDTNEAIEMTQSRDKVKAYPSIKIKETDKGIEKEVNKIKVRIGFPSISNQAVQRKLLIQYLLITKDNNINQSKEKEIRSILSFKVDESSVELLLPINTFIHLEYLHLIENKSKGIIEIEDSLIESDFFTNNLYTPFPIHPTPLHISLLENVLVTETKAIEKKIIEKEKAKSLPNGIKELKKEEKDNDTNPNN